MNRDQQPISSETRPPGCGDAGLQVLLVEDDESVRRYLEVVLQRFGYQVICAADGLAAMKVALAHPINLVVTDAIMPHLSGIQLARFLRSHEKLATIPIVMLTARSRDTAESGDVQVDAFLSKPINPDELKNCLQTLLERPPAV